MSKGDDERSVRSGEGIWSWRAGGLLLAALLVVAPAVTWAQESPPAEPPPAEEEEATPEGSNIGYEESVTVTARKLGEETVQEVPTSVAAPSEEQLRQRGADELEDVAANVAGFTVQNLGPGQSQVAMRGVSSGQIVRDQPGVKEQVGVYLDESVISLSLFTPDIDLFDMSRVEVLRGPQGTLFGSGSLSGTVRYISNQPELNSTASVAELNANTISDGGTGGSLKFAVNQPLGSTAAVRFTGYYTTYGGYTDAVQPNLSIRDDVNDGERWGGRLAFRFQPSDRVTVTPRILYQKVEMNGWNRIDVYNILGNQFTTTRPRVTLGEGDEREVFIQFDEPYTDEFLLADLNFDVELRDDLTLTSVTSYTDRDVLVVRDATALTASITGAGPIFLPANIYTLNAPLDDATQAKVLTQELRLSSAAERVQWVGGIFYSDTDRDYAQNLLVTGFEALSGIPTRGLRAPRDVLFFSDLSYDLKQSAVFGEAVWAVNDNLDLTGGLRYYDFEEDRTQVFDGLFGNDNNGTALVSQPGSTSADGFAPRLIASWKASEATRVNAQVSKGFRLGGINDPLNVPLCTPQDLATFSGHDRWEDETAWNYEVGSKSTFLGGRGTFNASVFYMDISDLQATLTAGSCSSRIILNVPKARSQGLELELAAAPSAAFDFSLSASYSDSELRSTLRDGAGNVIEGNEAGARMPTVPKFQAAAAATFQKPLRSDWLGYLTGTYQHIGSRYTQIVDQTPGFGTFPLRQSPTGQGIGTPFTQSSFTFDPELPAYDILNLRVGVLAQKIDVAFFINNVTDERALLSLDRERGKTARVAYLTNEPRTFGVSTRLHFR